ncbi:MAG: hypothetical protein ABSG43_04810 [Solirubrobacteraceae bacterium]|jgi:hypothetical protein
MTWTRNILVVANVTATSDELVSARRARAERESTAFTLVVPATTFGGGRAAAERTLQEALDVLRGAGLEVEGSVEAPDPVVAVTDVWDPKHHDEIIISTLPMRLSKWLHAGLPERVERLTGAHTTHVISQPPKRQPETAPAPAHERRPMGPLTVLAWGGQRQR